jgi:hypothetical protein
MLQHLHYYSYFSFLIQTHSSSTQRNVHEINFFEQVSIPGFLLRFINLYNNIMVYIIIFVNLIIIIFKF